MISPHPRTLLAFFVLSLWSLCLCSESRAADPELMVPYRLQVVLDFADNASLTGVFKDQVKRELEDNFRAAFGPLVKAEVVLDHPLLKDIKDKGLQAALDSWKAVSPVKTHFVLIDFANGQYDIQARQHDGLTGQASPVIRRERTPDRQFVARTAALLIDRDFGLVGMVVNKGDGQSVELAIKGAGLGVPLDRWVKKGDVFSLVQVVRSGGKERAIPVPWALLQAEDAPDKDGKLKCRLYHRHANPLAERPGSLGFRAVKLGTTSGPLRLRLVRYDPKAPTSLANMPVIVRRHGFEGEDGHKQEGATDSDGFYQTDREKPFDGIAFVSIIDRDTQKDAARVPVAIVDDRPVVVPLSIKAETVAPLQLRRNLWVQRLYDVLLTDRELFKDLGDLAAKPGQRAAAIDKAKAGLKGLEEDLDNLTRERDAIREELKESPAIKLDLNEGEKALAELKRDRDELREFIEGQGDALAKEQDPKRREQLGKVERAKALEREAEFGKALALYREAQEELNDPELQKKIDRLAAAWKTKGPEHEKARRFIYETWPEFDAARMKERVARAREAFEACKKAGDVLSLQKLLKAAVGHVAKLKQQQASLNPEMNEEDRKAAEELAAVLDDLAKLLGDVADYLEKALPKK